MRVLVRLSFGAIAAAVLAVALGLGAPATAAPMMLGTPLSIDFTDADKWSGAQGQNSFTASYGDLDVTASASTGALTFNANDKGGCLNGYNEGIHDLACDGDGLGINDDEITQGGNQKITIMFSTPVNLNDIELLDLFNNSSEVEVAAVRLNNGIFNTHVSSNLTGGYHRTLETGSDITMVILKAADDAHSDYALARISLTISSITNKMDSVPAPPAVLLMTPGLALMLRRRLRGDKAVPKSRWLWKRPSYMGWA